MSLLKDQLSNMPIEPLLLGFSQIYVTIFSISEKSTFEFECGYLLQKYIVPRGVNLAYHWTMS